jgi:hypothetical protein
VAGATVVSANDAVVLFAIVVSGVVNVPAVVER